jgi:hypothetical protein
VKLGVMFVAERHGEPCHVIPTSYVVALYVFAATNDTANTGLCTSGHALSCQAVIPCVAR